MLKKYYTYDKKTLFLITGLVTVSPLHKWGIFTPSHQLLTLTVLILGVYILENYRDYKIINISAYMGILYMGHRSFLLVYLIFLLMKYFFQKEREISKYIKSLLVFFVPSIIFYIYIRLLGYYPYDAATEYWGQFIWVLYFLAGKVKSVGEWYCQTIPENFSLSQNYPNPFNPTTKIDFTLPRSADVSIIIYNLMGQQVNVLMNSNLDYGYHTVTWNGLDQFGRPVSSGVYFSELRTRTFRQTKKMLLLK